MRYLNIKRGAALVAVVSLLSVGVATADTVTAQGANVVVDDADKVVTLDLASATSVSVDFKLEQANEKDGSNVDGNCNVDATHPATFAFSSTPSGVTAANISFTTCTTGASTQTSSFSAAVGDYAISMAQSGTSIPSLDVSGAAFTLRVVNTSSPSDTTAPVITPNVAGTLGNNGWYTSDVTVTWSVVDDESTITSSSGCDATTITANTTGTTLTCSAASAGGSASESVTIKRDGTVPDVDVTGVGDGDTYTLGSVPTAGCSTADATSGVAIAATVSSSGGPVGSVTTTCSGAKDNAGNTNSVSVTYSVIYDWNGFLRPVDNLPTLNVAKAGSAIPVKFQLGGDQGLSIFGTYVQSIGGVDQTFSYPRSTAIACGSESVTDNIEQTVTAGSSSLQYDPLTQTYTYVWKTDKSWAGTCRQLQVRLVDGTTHSANFKLTK